MVQFLKPLRGTILKSLCGAILKPLCSAILKIKKRGLFSVFLDKMCVFCLYYILDSQQYVKCGSCRRPILSGLPSLSFFFFKAFRSIFYFFIFNYVSYRSCCFRYHVCNCVFAFLILCHIELFLHFSMFFVFVFKYCSYYFVRIKYYFMFVLIIVFRLNCLCILYVVRILIMSY